MRDIGKNIKALRSQRNMTQDTLAEKLFVTRQTVSNYETGKSRPDVETLFKIADILEADINDILYEPEDTRLQRRRILIAVGLAAVMTVLGLLLSALTDYVAALRSQTFASGAETVLVLVLRLAYFFLLGYLFMGCVRLLLKAKPLSPTVRKWIGWMIPAAMLLIIIVFLPYFIMPAAQQLGFTQIHFPDFWLRSLLYITGHVDGKWIFLILGLILGLRADWNIKL